MDWMFLVIAHYPIDLMVVDLTAFTSAIKMISLFLLEECFSLRFSFDHVHPFFLLMEVYHQNVVVVLKLNIEVEDVVNLSFHIDFSILNYRNHYYAQDPMVVHYQEVNHLAWSILQVRESNHLGVLHDLEANLLLMNFDWNRSSIFYIWLYMSSIWQQQLVYPYLLDLTNWYNLYYHHVPYYPPIFKTYVLGVLFGCKAI